MPALIQEQTLLEKTKSVASAIKAQVLQRENLAYSKDKKQKVIESYQRLCKALAQEANLIAKTGPSMVPEVDFEVIHENGGLLPEGLADLVRDRGCLIIRNVVPEEQAVAWETELKEYTTKHKSVGGFPEQNPQNWSLWWTRPQVQIRSHPQILEAMDAVGKLWHTTQPNLVADFDTQVAYPDRFRIRYPSNEEEYTLNHHLDSGSTERWEDPVYRKCYQKIFDGEWEDYDAWCADHRPDANMDLYKAGANCSTWRSMQGWLSLSHTNTGEGTLRLLPSLKLSTAYLMLRPFFVDDETFNDVDATFPGAHPSKTQLLPTKELHPHLELDRTTVGIPPVKPGDYVFWHCDLTHEVDKFNPGKNDSSVVYNPCSPLTPYNLQALVRNRTAFLEARAPQDFISLMTEAENTHDDHGARKENILSEEGMMAMGFSKFDENQEGISPGQKEMRRRANIALGLS